MKHTLAFTLLLAATGAAAFGQPSGGIVPWAERKKPRPDLLKKVEFQQKLNAQIPLDLVFRDEEGRAVPLRTYFGRKPVALSLVYYECPMLCTLALNGQLRAYRALDYNIGDQFEVVTVSINPAEQPSLAAAKKASYLDKYRRRGAGSGWHFLTGEQASIRALADAVGFHYEYDPESKQFAHATALLVATPSGRIARYQYGVEYSARDLKLSLIDASENRIGTPVDKFLLYCFHYDPAAGKYSVAVLNLVRGGAVFTFIGLLAFIVIATRRHRPRTLDTGVRG